MIHIMYYNFIIFTLCVILFLTIHEMARLIESDELPQKNRVLTTGVGAVVISISDILVSVVSQKQRRFFADNLLLILQLVDITIRKEITRALSALRSTT